MTTKAHKLDVSRASTLNTKLQLAQVHLFAVAADRGAGGAAPPFSFSTRFDSPAFADFPTEVVALFPFVTTIERRGKERTPIVELRVAFRVVYRKSDTFTPDDTGAVADYVGIVGWMQVWPYIRAEIQSLSTKLGFPPLLLPVLLPGQTADVPVKRLPDAAGEAPPRGTKKSKVTKKASKR